MMSVSFLIPIHDFEWLFPQAVAGRYVHVPDPSEKLLTLMH